VKSAIRLASDTDDEQRTKSELEALLDTFNLAPWCFTPDVVVDEIADELKQRYPGVPVGAPDGCRSTLSTALHLIVCWQEIDALGWLIGRADADQFGRRMAESGHYRWVYATVINDFDVLAGLYEPRGLRICP
jgi:hypothetical protein